MKTEKQPTTEYYTKTKIKISELVFRIHNAGQFNLTEFCRAMKTKYESFEDYKNANPRTHPEIFSFISENWENIIPYKFQDAIQEQNTEKRRALFQCIGPEKVFKQADAKLLNKQVINKTRYEWDEKHRIKTKTFEDTYELYSIPSKLLFKSEDNPRRQQWNQVPDYIYAVRCWCTTTKREYWIMVKKEAVKNQDAVEAIAWTMQFPKEVKKDIIKIFRQGDILIAETKTKHEKTYSEYNKEPLTKEEYLSLLYSET